MRALLCLCTCLLASCSLLFQPIDEAGTDASPEPGDANPELADATPIAPDAQILTLTIPVDTGEDDARELKSGGAVALGEPDLELGNLVGEPTIVGLRFVSVQIPPGATIVRATIQFRSDEQQTATANLNLSVEKNASPAPFEATSTNLSARQRHEINVAWMNVPNWFPGQMNDDHRTPDIATLVQAVIDTKGWSVGGAIVVLIDGEGARVATSHESGIPATLGIQYY